MSYIIAVTQLEQIQTANINIFHQQQSAMRKTSSKSVLSTRKTKTTGTIPESKKVSRVTKTNSCIKINSQNTEQNVNYNATMPINKEKLQQLSEKLLTQLQAKHSNSQGSHHHIDRPSSRQSRKTNQQERTNKISLETVPNASDIDELKAVKSRNQELSKENVTLKEKYCELQQMSLKDKEKIKNLIIRINEVKQGRGMTTQAKTIHPSTSNLPLYQASSTVSCAVLSHKKKIETPSRVIKNDICQNQECLERKKYLESELYKERISRDRLEAEKKEWEKNKQSLKRQYNELLSEIREMRNDQS